MENIVEVLRHLRVYTDNPEIQSGDEIIINMKGKKVIINKDILKIREKTYRNTVAHLLAVCGYTIPPCLSILTSVNAFNISVLEMLYITQGPTMAIGTLRLLAQESNDCEVLKKLLDIIYLSRFSSTDKFRFYPDNHYIDTLVNTFVQTKSEAQALYYVWKNEESKAKQLAPHFFDKGD
jgi:hypothetical protein